MVSSVRNDLEAAAPTETATACRSIGSDKESPCLRIVSWPDSRYAICLLLTRRSWLRVRSGMGPRQSAVRLVGSHVSGAPVQLACAVHCHSRHCSSLLRSAEY